MTERTTIDKLRSLVLHRKHAWLWVKDNYGYSHIRRADEYPDPNLPPQDYLEGAYLLEIAGSNPKLLKEAQRLVSFAGKERK